MPLISQRFGGLMETHSPINVKPLADYRLLITFDNEEERIFDMNP
jgi:hypothetical protein